MIKYTVVANESWGEMEFDTLEEAENFAPTVRKAVIYKVIVEEVWRERVPATKKPLKIKWSSLPEIDR